MFVVAQSITLKSPFQKSDTGIYHVISQIFVFSKMHVGSGPET